MKILLDNGHGIETPKRSPDGKLLEYQYNRLIASRVTSELCDCGYDAQLLVAEISDVPLAERCRRVNAICDEVGTTNVILVSIHVNTADADGYNKAAEFIEPKTPVTTAIALKSDYDEKYGAPSAGDLRCSSSFLRQHRYRRKIGQEACTCST